MVQVYVPAGEFLMGSLDSDKDAEPDEKPQHKVTLDGFWIDRTEVTNAQFAAFVEATGYETDAQKTRTGGILNLSAKKWEVIPNVDWRHPRGPASSLDGLEQHPVVEVSWNDASAYCQWAGRRLPTEAEWEKAARGTDGAQYPWGNGNAAGNLLNVADRNLVVPWADKGINDAYQFTAPAGSYPDGASPYGVLDMAGNAYEWVADWYAATYYAGSPARNPTGPAQGHYRALRGGGWDFILKGARAANRDWNEPVDRNGGNGFRCAGGKDE